MIPEIEVATTKEEDPSVAIRMVVVVVVVVVDGFGVVLEVETRRPGVVVVRNEIGTEVGVVEAAVAVAAAVVGDDIILPLPIGKLPPRAVVPL